MSIKRVLALIGIIVVSNCWAAVGPGKGYNPEAIEQVAAGEVPTANASWWGFDAADATTQTNFSAVEQPALVKPHGSKNNHASKPR